ncbi:MAG: phage tail protein [Pseudomonadota bacterium]
MVVVGRRDPLRVYQFGLRFLPEVGGETSGAARGGDHVAGISRVSGLTATVSSAEIWSGGNSLHPHVHPDRCSWAPITLEQGIAKDGSLSAWAEASLHYAATGTAPPSGLGAVKRRIALDVWDPFATTEPRSIDSTVDHAAVPQHPSFTYIVSNAWVSKFEPVPALDAMSSEIAFLTVELTHEGWHRIAVEPSPGGLDDPDALVPDPDDVLGQPGGPDLFPGPPDNMTA